MMITNQKAIVLVE